MHSQVIEELGVFLRVASRPSIDSTAANIRTVRVIALRATAEAVLPVIEALHAANLVKIAVGRAKLVDDDPAYYGLQMRILEYIQVLVLLL